MIAGQDAKATGINRQRLVQSELRREVSNMQVRLIRVLRLVPARFGQMCLELGVDTIDVGHQSVIVNDFRKSCLRDLPEQLDRIVIHILPQLAIQPTEHIHRVGVPDPPEILRDLQQRLK